MKQLILCAIPAIILSGCKLAAGYTGPSLKFSLGYQGIEAGITLYSKKPASESITEAGKAFDALVSPAGSGGKTPIPQSP